MAITHQIFSKGSTSKFSEAIPKLHAPGDYVIVARGVPRSIVMACPDGCGEILPINLDRRVGKAWRTYESGQELTVYPSVWRDTGCRAHFIIWRNKILWADGSGYVEPVLDQSFLSSVLSRLSTESFMSFETIAEDINLIPWEVLWACNTLVRQGRAFEGKQGFFRRKNEAGGTLPPPGRIDILV